MKKLSVLMLFAAIGMMFTTSCTKDETFSDPTISFQNGTTSMVFNGTNSVDVNITFAAEGKIESVSLLQPTTTGTQTLDLTKKMGQAYSTNAGGELSATYFFKVADTTLAALFATNNTLTFKFTLVDQQAKETSATFTVTKPSATTPLSVSKTGMFYHIAGLLDGAYDLDADATVPSTQPGATKSMKNTDIAGAAFTGTWASATQNGTMYVKSNSFDFANATEEAAAAAYTAGTASATVTNPAVNDIYIGKKGTTYYAIKITALLPNFSTGTGGNTGKITFDYKKK